MKEAYLRSVGALLDCPAKERERLLERLEDAVSAYLEDAPDAGEMELIENFGAPEVCAAQLLAECDPMAVADARRRRKCHNRILIAALTVFLALAVGVAAYLWSNGGLVVIEAKEYVNGFPEDITRGEVTYHFDEEDIS